MRYSFAIPLLYLLSVVFACKNDPPVQIPDNRPEAAQAAEKGQKKADFLSHRNVSFDVTVHWDGRAPLQAHVLQRTDGSRIFVRKNTGNTLVFDGSNGWMTPAGQQDPDARFDLQMKLPVML